METCFFSGIIYIAFGILGFLPSLLGKEYRLRGLVNVLSVLLVSVGLWLLIIAGIWFLYFND